MRQYLFTQCMEESTVLEFGREPTIFTELPPVEGATRYDATVPVGVGFGHASIGRGTRFDGAFIFKKAPPGDGKGQGWHEMGGPRKGGNERSVPDGPHLTDEIV